VRPGIPLIRTSLKTAKHGRLGLAARESGFAVPTVLFMVMAAFALASVAVVSSIQSQNGTTRDLDTKDALAVAEAGAHEALLRYNATAAEVACVPPQTLSGGWCSEATGSLPGGGAFTYWVRPAEGEIEVVSQATKDGVTRRVDMSAHSAAGTQPFIDAGIIGLNGIHLDSNSTIGADVATNGDVNLDSNSGLCGNAQVGVGHDVTGPGSHTCGTVLQGSVTLPTVNQGDAPTHNHNSNFFANTPLNGRKDRVCFNGFDANASPSSLCGSRELVIRGGGPNGGTALTLPSGDYSLCRLELISNSTLYIDSGASVRIWFDSPEACGYAGGSPQSVQLKLDANSRITANGDSSAIDVAMLFVGSESRSTSIELASNTMLPAVCFQNFVIYAPRSDVHLNSNTYYCGAIGARSVHLDSNSQVQTSNQAQDFTLPNSPAHYVVDRFIECGGPATTAPDSSC
jgi:hypothetical protein